MTDGWESDGPPFNLEAGVEFLRDAVTTREAGANETVVRQIIVTNLAEMFPRASRPWWIERHIRGAESRLRFLQEGLEVSGYADSVVGLTAIEYESDLRIAAKFRTGKFQVRQYCAGLLNAGAAPEKIRGVLSDGVEWHAYRLGPVETKAVGAYDVSDVELEDIEAFRVGPATDDEAHGLVRFLTAYLGRPGARPLTAASVADYLGFDSGFGRTYLERFGGAVATAVAEDPTSAELVRTIWSSFVAYLSAESPAFDVQTYVQEFYLSTLAKLICANVLERRAVLSRDADMDRILDGRYFHERGLRRLVEHDYFGWLSTTKHVDKIRPLAMALQSDLAAYDFDAPPNGDLFGQLLATLGERTQRVLLGQEWTPSWLARRMAKYLISQLPAGERPRFIDMSCGSGSMVVETTRAARELLLAEGVQPNSQEFLDALVAAATGFDIDPLAVLLAKVNWAVSNRDALEPLDGSRPISLPIFHADSLFALAPVFDQSARDASSSEDYVLRLLETQISLPRFLVQPANQRLFDALMDGSYGLALHAATTEVAEPALRRLVSQLLADAIAESVATVSADETEALVGFLTDIVSTLAQLQRDGRNGVWVFVIRNSYRPGLVAGQFNGLISNPPWLALSKIADNPFGPVLHRRADEYELVPPGSAFLHLEMATTFLAYALDHYLAPGAQVACVLPDTVRNGGQHRPLRMQLSAPDVARRVKLRMDELWLVERGVFKNRASVVVGARAEPQVFLELPGRKVSPDGDEPVRHYVASSGERYVWGLEFPGQGVPGAYPRGTFNQGADLMPRRLLFFDVKPVSGGRVTIGPIARDSPNWYLLAGAKKHDDFKPKTRTLPARFAHRCLLSAHVGPFAVAEPAVAMLPVVRSDAGVLRLATGAELALSSSARDHFAEVVDESDFDSFEDFWRAGLDFRSKLSRQRPIPPAWLVVYGAGGGIPAAAMMSISDAETPVLVDQTLYWATVATEDEAFYLCGLINSDVLLSRIQDFIPEGEFGDRHLHTLPATAVPEFDPADTTHADVVTTTRTLVQELLAARAADQSAARLFTTELSMSPRRRRLRELIRSLPGYDSYTQACVRLYDAMIG